MKGVAVSVVFFALLSLSARLSAQQLGGGETDKPVPQKAEDLKARIEAAAKEAQLVFMATVDKVQVVAQTNSVPPSVLMQVTLKDPGMLKGPKPETLNLPLTFNYSAVQGRGFTPQADQKVLVAGSAVLAAPIIGGPPTLPGQEQKVAVKLNVVLLVEATEENVAAAKKAVGDAPQPKDPKAKLDAAVRTAELVFTATVDKAREVGMFKPPLVQVTVKDVVMLKGEAPTVLDCPYSLADEHSPAPKAGQKVLCAAHPGPKEDTLPPNSTAGRHSGPLPVLGGNGPQIFLLAEATEDNVSIAKKALAGAAQPDKKAQ